MSYSTYNIVIHHNCTNHPVHPSHAVLYSDRKMALALTLDWLYSSRHQLASANDFVVDVDKCVTGHSDARFGSSANLKPR